MSQIRNKKPISIKWRIFIVLSVFVALILAFLWVFQIFLLEPFYMATKENHIKSAASDVVEIINDSDIDTELDTISQDSQSCIVICDDKGTPLYDKTFSPKCMIHDRNGQVNYTMIYELLTLTEKNGGVYMQKGPTFGGRNDNMFEMQEKTILYTQLTTNSDGEKRLIIMNSNVASVTAAQTTLLIELILITGITIILAAAAALFLSVHISKPIRKLNVAAKKLAEGDYKADFDENGYKEITELAKTLNYAASELSKVDTLQKELIANVSHDLRTPLTMIIGYGEVMRDLPGENTPENVQVIIDEATRLTTLVNDMLDISKLQSGTIQLSVSTFSLTETVREILKRYNKMSEYELIFDYSEEIFIEGDAVKISQVIYNLMNNAITYTGADKKIYINQKAVDGNRVRLTIRDTGEGIAPEYLQDIWNRYYKVDKAHKRAQVGTGLGLSIVKTILDLHPGTTYGVDSKLGEGSSFWFEMKILKTDSKLIL